MEANQGFIKGNKKTHTNSFQDPYGSLSPRMTVGEIIGEGLGVHFKSKAETQKRMIRFLQMLVLI